MLNNLLSSYVFDTLEPIAKWISIGVLGTFVLALLIIFFSKKELRRNCEVLLLLESDYFLYCAKNSALRRNALAGPPVQWESCSTT